MQRLLLLFASGVLLTLVMMWCIWASRALPVNEVGFWLAPWRNVPIQYLLWVLTGIFAALAAAVLARRFSTRTRWMAIVDGVVSALSALYIYIQSTFFVPLEIQFFSFSAFAFWSAAVLCGVTIATTAALAVEPKNA